MSDWAVQFDCTSNTLILATNRRLAFRRPLQSSYLLKTLLHSRNSSNNAANLIPIEDNQDDTENRQADAAADIVDVELELTLSEVGVENIGLFFILFVIDCLIFF